MKKYPFVKKRNIVFEGNEITKPYKFSCLCNIVKLGNKELFGHPKIVP